MSKESPKKAARAEQREKLRSSSSAAVRTAKSVEGGGPKSVSSNSPPLDESVAKEKGVERGEGAVFSISPDLTLKSIERVLKICTFKPEEKDVHKYA
jgi:hypothetical protein